MPVKYIKKKDRLYKTPCKYKYAPAEAIFDNTRQYGEYIDGERASSKTMLKNFTKNQRLVLFLTYKFKWGRRKIRRRTGLSEYFVNQTVTLLKNNNF
ncbi:MAG: hypothetical protein FWC85_02800 [Elusimicrobia bacterium]|nr:hypothetical protein [Elusimicrobiota bacterium]